MNHLSEPSLMSTSTKEAMSAPGNSAQLGRENATMYERVLLTVTSKTFLQFANPRLRQDRLQELHGKAKKQGTKMCGGGEEKPRYSKLTISAQGFKAPLYTKTEKQRTQKALAVRISPDPVPCSEFRLTQHDGRCAQLRGWHKTQRESRSDSKRTNTHGTACDDDQGDEQTSKCRLDIAMQSALKWHDTPRENWGKPNQVKHEAMAKKNGVRTYTFGWNINISQW